jgi:ferredoxin-type protein NapH
MIHKKGIPATLVIVLVYLAFSLFIQGGNFTTLKTGIPYGIALLFTGFILFRLCISGKVNTWRNIFFCTYALVFVISFLWDIVVVGRGHMWLLDQEALSAEAPMCHIVSVMDMLPLILRRVNVFPTTVRNSIFGVLAYAIATGVVFGRGFCAWGCFFGGQESLCASIPKKARWKIHELHPFLRYFAFGLLAFLVLHSFSTLTPTYCIWLCPFKATTEFFEINSFLRVLQTDLFFSLWLVLVILLPLLTKKRTQCSFLCPMGAYFSLTNAISPFYVKIDRERCGTCGRCTSVCPTFSLSKAALARGKTHRTCTKCGACIEACPQQAISYAIKGVSFTGCNHPLLQHWENPGPVRRFFSELFEPGTIFIFSIFILGSFLFSGSFAKTITIILKLLGIEL